MIEAGTLDRRAILQQGVEDTDSSGFPVTTWVTLATVWAGRRNLKGREAVEATAIVAEADTVFTVRHSTTTSRLDTSDRIKLGSEYFQILNLTPIPGGRPEKIEILAKYRQDLQEPSNIRTTDGGEARTTDGGATRITE